MRATELAVSPWEIMNSSCREIKKYAKEIKRRTWLSVHPQGHLSFPSNEDEWGQGRQGTGQYKGVCFYK